MPGSGIYLEDNPNPNPNWMPGSGIYLEDLSMTIKSVGINTAYSLTSVIHMIMSKFRDGDRVTFTEATIS